MAQSGSFTGSIATGYTLRVDWSESGVDVTTNTSDLTVTAYLVCGGNPSTGYYINSSVKKNISFVVNGTTYSSTCSINCGRGETITLFTKTVSNIAHNNNGAKSVDISCTVSIKATLNGSYISSASASGTATLTTIARASQPSCVTWPDHTQNVGSFGDTISIFMNRKSDSFKHTVRYAFGSLTGTIATGVTNDTSWTIPKSFMNKIPNDLKGSGTIYVDTYNGSTLVGTKYCGFTATVPTTNDCYPSCSLTLEDISEAGQYYGRPVKGLSQIKITVNTTLAYSSPIASCTITANGSTYSGTSATTAILKTAGSSPITATVKDKRGRTCKTAASYTMTVMDYVRPAIKKLSVNRCDADGTENDQGDSVKITLSADVSSMSGAPSGKKNTATYTLRYKKSSSTAWTSIDMSSYNNVYSLTNQTFIINNADGNSSYDVEATVTDKHGSASKSTSVSTAFTLINWHPSGTGIAFGKVSEKENTFELGLPVDGLVDKNEVFKPGSDDEIDTIMSSVYSQMPDESKKSITLYFTYSSSVLGGGRWSVDIYRGSLNYGYAIVARYENSKYPTICTRCYYNGVWGEWGWPLLRYLPLTGGTVTGDTYVTATTFQHGRFMTKTGWLGMYPTVADATAATNRQGWMGYDTGDIFTINDAKSGIDFISKGNHRFAAGGTNVMTLTSTTLRPIKNDYGYVGDSSYKWKAVYAVNGTIQTSDRNAKKDIEEIDQRYIDLFDRLMPVSFMFNDKESDRTHIGFISQDVEAAMAEVGLTDLDFAGFCRDVRTETVDIPNEESPIVDEEGNPVLDKDGNPTYNTKQIDKPVLDEDGKPVYIYSLRYTEFIALNTKMIQMARKETASLRAELEELKQLVLSMNN